MIAQWLEEREREKKKTTKGDRCESAKDPPTIKSISSLEHKDGELVSSRTYLGLFRLDPFIRDLGVSLLVQIHGNHGRCAKLIEKM